MHDTHDVRKSKDLHDKEMLFEMNKHDLECDHIFRNNLIEVLERIAKALEMPIQVRKEF